MSEGKSAEAFRTISEVAEELGVPQHVLRFWETKFSAVRPMKRAGNRRYYRPEDLALLRVVNKLLYVDGYTIRGVQKLLKESGHRQLVGSLSGEDAAAVPAAAAETPIAPASISPVAASSGEGSVLNDLKRLRAHLADALQAAA